MPGTAHRLLPQSPAGRAEPQRPSRNHVLLSGTAVSRRTASQWRLWCSSTSPRIWVPAPAVPVSYCSPSALLRRLTQVPGRHNSTAHIRPKLPPLLNLLITRTVNRLLLLSNMAVISRWAIDDEYNWTHQALTDLAEPTTAALWRWLSASKRASTAPTVSQTWYVQWRFRHSLSRAVMADGNRPAYCQ